MTTVTKIHPQAMANNISMANFSNRGYPVDAAAMGLVRGDRDLGRRLTRGRETKFDM